jgi:hypothetical protein
MFVMFVCFVSRTLAQNAIYIEAESAPAKDLGALKVGNDAKAFGGKFIQVPNGVGNDQPNSVARYEFTVSGGTYWIWGRVISPTGSDDSYFWGIDNKDVLSNENCPGKMPGDQRHIWDPGDANANWTWVSFNSRNCEPFKSAKKVDLPAGKHVLNIFPREDGTQLDGIVISGKELKAADLPDTEAKANALKGQVAVEPKAKLTTAWSHIKLQRF